MKKRILIYGEHPFSFTGNGNMMCALLSQIDPNKYEVVCLLAGNSDPILYDVFKVMPFNLVSVSTGGDTWGLDYLMKVVMNKQYDMFITVGIDIWRLEQVIEPLRKELTNRGVPWIGIMPYDIPSKNSEFLNLMDAVDIKCIYSQFGYTIVNKHLKNVKYYRPKLMGSYLYQKLPDAVSAGFYNTHLTSLPTESFVFGFVGNNQIRKEPYKVLKAFLNAQKILEGKREIGLYMHTESTGAYNLKRLGNEWGVDKPSSIVFKAPGVKYNIQDMISMYNGIDCLVLPSTYEGLSWTPIEAMLCETLVLLSDNTAHTELVNDDELLIPCKESVMVPVGSSSKFTHIESLGATVEDITDYMVNIVMMDDNKRADIISRNKAFADDWVNGCHDVSDVIQETFHIIEEQKKKAVADVPEVLDKQNRILFIQRSAGGDVLMTTLCFKGLKERHPGMALDYMTEPQYMNIVEDNPYIDTVLPYSPELAEGYRVVYNPHEERILPGSWGRNSNSILTDFYWKLLMVEPDTQFGIVPDDNLPEWVTDSIKQDKPLCIIHTTGGDPHFRTYKYMPDVCEIIENRYYTIQMGGADDYPAAAELDLRGQLSYRQEAYIMSKASLAITVDSFMAHLAGAMGVSQIALYGSGNAAVCRPKQLGGNLITLEPDYIKYCPGLGPCSASIRNCPVPCTGLHDPKRIISAIDEIESMEVVA